jgi:cob(I)alamin adenosyltransferase
MPGRMALTVNDLVGISNALVTTGEFANETRQTAIKAFDAIEVLATFCNELSGDIFATSKEVSELKAWLRAEIREELDRARRELRAEIEQATNQQLEQSRTAQKRAEREVAELDKLLASPGPKKIIHVVRDCHGEVKGAVVTTDWIGQIE